MCADGGPFTVRGYGGVCTGTGRSRGGGSPVREPSVAEGSTLQEPCAVEAAAGDALRQSPAQSGGVSGECGERGVSKR